MRRNHIVSTPQERQYTNTDIHQRHTSQEIPRAHADDPFFQCNAQTFVTANASELSVHTVVHAFLHTSFHVDSEVCSAQKPTSAILKQINPQNLDMYGEKQILVTSKIKKLYL